MNADERFVFALRYALENEGGWSDDPDDHGGATMFGITEHEARRFGYDVRTLTRDQAALIYRAEYFAPLEWIEDARVAAKAFDICVNVGVFAGVKILQRAAKGCINIDGIVGDETRACVSSMNSDEMLERLSREVAFYYLDIVKRNASQMKFLRGWISRAIRRPSLAT